jgi:hypothetical protein
MQNPFRVLLAISDFCHHMNAVQAYSPLFICQLNGFFLGLVCLKFFLFLNSVYIHVWNSGSVVRGQVCIFIHYLTWGSGWNVESGIVSLIWALPLVLLTIHNCILSNYEIYSLWSRCNICRILNTTSMYKVFLK